MSSTSGKPAQREVSQLQEEALLDLLKRNVGRPTLLRLMVLKWAHGCMREGVPRAGVAIFLLGMVRRLASVGNQSSGLREMWKWRTLAEPIVDVLREAEEQISRVMADRNQRAQQLEAAGRLDEAIELYETNITDGFQGLLPYERLRIVYTERKDYANAVRVCETAIRNRVPLDPSHLARLRQIYKKE
jgi:tetratricopeptide (TPR) repeat protein